MVDGDYLKFYARNDVMNSICAFDLKFATWMSIAHERHHRKIYSLQKFCS